MRVGQEGDPFGRGLEDHAMPGEAGADPQRDRDVRLAGAGRVAVALLIVLIFAGAGAADRRAGRTPGVELAVLGWTIDEVSGEMALFCRLVDGSAGEIPARWTDLPVRVEPQRAVGGFGSPAGWRLLLARGERLAGGCGGGAREARS